MVESSEYLEPDWNATRAVWLTAGVVLNETRSKDQENLLDELKRAAEMFREMKRVDMADHERSWTMQDGAQMCRELIQFVSNIDEIALPRLVRGGIRNLNTTMTTLITSLAELEVAFKHAPEVIRVRRRKHEFHDLLVVRLAESFERYTDLRILFTPGSYMEGKVYVLDDHPGMTCGAAQPRPESSGVVHAVSHDPADHPIVKPNYLAAEADQRITIAGLRLVRAFFKSAELAPYFERETLPGAEVHTDDELLDFARRRGNTGYHLVGTCRMGPATSRGTVVDDELRIHGVESLRVVDASIMPICRRRIHSRRRSQLPKRAPTLFGDVAEALPAREARSADCGRQSESPSLPIVGCQSLAHLQPSVTAFPSMRTTSIIKPPVAARYQASA